ncbi:MAG: terminase, partial [Armatimonadetes bacterium]|nr:terminase [Armatimonadota bacterium]
KRTWFFKNGARLKMRYLDRDEDAEKYQGHSYTWVAFEELTNWPDPTPVDKMRATMRSGASPVPASFRATANPGGVGHNWVKSRYIDPSPPMVPFVYVEEETGAAVDRVFIPSLLEDNAALMENDPNYWNRVAVSAGGNKALLKAWRYGLWDIVAGGMFDDVFERKRHVIKPFEIPESWYVDRSFDWGESKPFSVGWWAESDGTEAPNGRTYPRGTLFRIYEWYGCGKKPNTGIRLGSRDIAKGIIEREGEVPVLRGHTVHKGPADTSIFDAEDGVSLADKMKAEGVEWERADKRPGSRKTGWSTLRERLANGKAKPLELPSLFVFDTCIDWVRTVPVLPRDKRDTDDVDSKSEDHAGDETRYRIMVPPKPVPQEIEEPMGYSGGY